MRHRPTLPLAIVSEQGEASNDAGPAAGGSAFARAVDLERQLEEIAQWAINPLCEAEQLVVELADISGRLDVPYGSLRAITAAALGECDQRNAADRTIERKPEMRALVTRLRRIGRDLSLVVARARKASNAALQLAISAPGVVARAFDELRVQPSSAERDTAAIELMRLPQELKRRAELIRADAVSLPARARIVRRRLTDALPGTRLRHGARVVTQKLARVADRPA